MQFLRSSFQLDTLGIEVHPLTVVVAVLCSFRSARLALKHLITELTSLHRSITVIVANSAFQQEFVNDLWLGMLIYRLFISWRGLL